MVPAWQPVLGCSALLLLISSAVAVGVVGKVCGLEGFGSGSDGRTETGCFRVRTCSGSSSLSAGDQYSTILMLAH